MSCVSTPPGQLDAAIAAAARHPFHTAGLGAHGPGWAEAVGSTVSPASPPDAWNLASFPTRAASTSTLQQETAFLAAAALPGKGEGANDTTALPASIKQLTARVREATNAVISEAAIAHIAAGRFSELKLHNFLSMTSLIPFESFSCELEAPTTEFTLSSTGSLMAKRASLTRHITSLHDLWEALSALWLTLGLVRGFHAQSQFGIFVNSIHGIARSVSFQGLVIYVHHHLARMTIEWGAYLHTPSERALPSWLPAPGSDVDFLQRLRFAHPAAEGGTQPALTGSTPTSSSHSRKTAAKTSRNPSPGAARRDSSVNLSPQDREAARLRHLCFRFLQSGCSAPNCRYLHEAL